jgi:hypothetical protein
MIVAYLVVRQWRCDMRKWKVIIGMFLMLLAGVLFLLAFANSFYLDLDDTLMFYIAGIIVGTFGVSLWAMGVWRNEV